MGDQQIPQTDSSDELAYFWDTHDLTDFENQLEEIRDPVFEREQTVTVHLAPEEAEALRKMAQAHGVGDADLIRQWVQEKIRVR
jgi:predicted DNA binding CopG/RHH family protein